MRVQTKLESDLRGNCPLNGRNTVTWWRWLCWSVGCGCVDASHGFGGKFGVEEDRQDASALGFDHQEKLTQHASQKGAVNPELSLPGLSQKGFEQ